MGRRTTRATVVGVLALAVVVVLAAPAAAVDRAQVRRPGPLRVLLVGDSITVNYQDLAARALGVKGYQVIKGGIASSSLLDTGICDGTFAKNLLTFVDPDVVIYENNGNFANRSGIPPCKQLTYGSTAFYRRWKNAASLNQRTLMRKGARFFWIQAPSVNFEPKRTAVPQINAIYRLVAGTKAGLVDAWTSFGGARFDRSLRYDAQHLNAAGAQRLANLVAAAVG